MLCSYLYLDTTNAELDESAKHLSASNLVRRTTDGDFDQQRVVVGLQNGIFRNRLESSCAMTYSNLCTSEAGACVETNPVTARTAVHFNLTRVGLEACPGIFGGDTALDGKTTLRDSLLGKTELR